MLATLAIAAPAAEAAVEAAKSTELIKLWQDA
jgi:hypothetical protein